MKGGIILKDKKFIFVLMPFDSSFDDVYKLGIKETIKNIDPKIVVERLDEQLFSEGMLTRIYNQIEKADLVLADMTGKNSNVFYEVGYAHAKEKSVVLITKEASDIPFDLKHYRHIVYGNAISELKKQLKENVEWALKEIENKDSVPLEVELSVSGNLEKTTYNDIADIQLKIDFTNISKEKTVNIDAVYFYTQNGWKFKQNGSECSQVKSDIKNYHIKHQIVPQITRIPKGNWSQISLGGTRVLATSYLGEELKERYILQGLVNIRVVTNKDSFDYEKSINLTIDNIPF